MVLIYFRSPQCWNRTLQPPKYRHRRNYAQQDFELDTVQTRSGFQDLAPYIFGGAMLVAAFAFAGHQIGRNADAHTAGPDIEVPAAKADSVVQKGSLLVEGDNFEMMGLNALRRQTVMSDGKSDMMVMDAGEAADPQVMPDPKPILKPVKKIAKLAERHLKIEPASVNLGEDVEPSAKTRTLKKLAVAPKPDTIEDSFKLPKAEKQKIIAQRRVRQAEENCLARAVYFEARSESALGQMAVAKVILNRVKSPQYPNTICGVVYQGTQRRNSCQFSFACDGQPDDVKQAGAWAQAKSVAQRAIKGDMNLGSGMNTATSYHADYVTPRWAKTLRKVSRIGRHIFYSGT
jgi:spore germination cell wall hydrolase CwlJ-like protein